MDRIRSVSLPLAAAVATLLGITGCSGEEADTVATASGIEVPIAESSRPAAGASSYFFDSTTDLTSFADFIVLASVVDESVGEIPSDGEGLVRRDGSIDVERVLWKLTEDQVVPTNFDLQLEGFWYGEHGLHPIELEGAPRLKAGDSFVGAFFRQGDKLVLVTQSSALLVRDGKVTLTDEQRNPPLEADLVGGTARRDLHGQTIDQVTRTFSQSEPQPGNRKYDQVPQDHRRARQEQMGERSSKG